jgi:hypothetical protein
MKIPRRVQWVPRGTYINLHRNPEGRNPVRDVTGNVEVKSISDCTDVRTGACYECGKETSVYIKGGD